MDRDAHKAGEVFKRRLRQILVILPSCMGSLCFSAQAQPTDCEAALPGVLDQDLVLQRVARCNREVLAAERAVMASQADRVVAGQTPNPTFSSGIGTVNPKLGIGSGSYLDKTFDTSLRLEQLIERGGKRALRTQAAQQLVLAAEQDVADVKRQQSAAALQAMVDLAAAEGKVNLLSEVAALYEESLHANTRRKNSGDLAPVEAQRQEIDVVHAQLDLARARRTLAGLLAWELHSDALQVNPLVLDSAAAMSDALEQPERADIKAARLRLQAALVTRDVVRAQSKADVTVGLQLDHWPVSESNPVGTGDTFSVSISLPFMTYHHFEGELARAMSDSEAARANLQRVEANANTEWALLNAAVASAQARLQLLKNEQIPLSEQVARATERGYSKGALSVLELLDARRVLRQTQLDVLAARADLARAEFTRKYWIVN